MNNEKINELYDKMLSTTVVIAQDGITNESIEALNSIKKETEELTSETSVVEVAPQASTPEKAEGHTVMQTYDPTTGNTRVEDNSENLAAKISNQQFNNLLSGGEVTSELISDALKDMSKNTDDETSVLASVVGRRMGGEDFNIYEALPKKYQDQINDIYRSTAMQYGSTHRVYSKNSIAKMMVDGMIEEFNKSINTQVDLDTILTGFSKDLEKTTNDFSKEMGGIMLSYDEERKAEIEAAIKKCEESGNTESIKKLTDMYDSIDESFKLTKFIKFCRTCKIKNVEMREPEKRAFDYFNSKYATHRYTINDIRTCPIILDRHLTECTHEQNVALCVAFCKYCLNMSPDNMNEHTFMYYFIRNIIAMDRLNPKGLMYGGMDEKSKTFYDSYKSALISAIENLKARNVALS